MSRVEERRAARRLADVLDGAEAPDRDLEAMARILRDAAAAARFDVSDADVEHALERTRPATVERPPRSRVRIAAVGLAAAVVLAAVILLATPFTSGPVQVDVQARALAALGGPGDVLSVAELIRPGPAGSFPTSVRTGWIDVAHDRQRWTQSVRGTIVAETLVDHGRITRYDPVSGTAVVAASCSALASGCAEAIDPVAVYRRALEDAGPLRTHARTEDGRRVYRVSLPVQRLADSTRIVQVATLDARTFLPLRIVWRELEAGGGRAFAVIGVRDISTVPFDSLGPSALDLELPPGTPTTQLSAPGVPVRLLGVRRLTLAEARTLHPHPWWLGRSYGRRRPTDIVLLRYTGGTAVRMRYGRITVWTYGRVVPPPLLGARTPAKSIPMAGGVARFYGSQSGALIGERTIPGATVAIRAPGNADGFSALMRARPL